MSEYLQSRKLLNSGHEIPVVGLGTFELLGSKGERAISSALKLGYRNLDTAQMYGNEDIIGRCLQSYDRSAVYISSKIAPWQHGYKATIDAANNILQNLQTDYVDLLLLHWPGVYGLDHGDQRQVELRHESYRALEVLQDMGKVRSIGVSNFLDHHLNKLFDVCSIKPAVNQLEFHPLCHEDDLVQYCSEEGIAVEAYCTLARADNRLWNSSMLEDVVRDTGKTKSQVILKWALNKGVIILPKTRSVKRLKENSLLDFQLSSAQMRRIDSLHDNIRVDWNPHLITE